MIAWTHRSVWKLKLQQQPAAVTNFSKWKDCENLFRFKPGEYCSCLHNGLTFLLIGTSYSSLFTPPIWMSLHPRDSFNKVHYTSTLYCSCSLWDWCSSRFSKSEPALADWLSPPWVNSPSLFLEKGKSEIWEKAGWWRGVAATVSVSAPLPTSHCPLPEPAAEWGKSLVDHIYCHHPKLKRPGRLKLSGKKKTFPGIPWTPGY